MKQLTERSQAGRPWVRERLAGSPRGSCRNSEFTEAVRQRGAAHREYILQRREKGAEVRVGETQRVEQQSEGWRAWLLRFLAPP